MFLRYIGGMSSESHASRLRYSSPGLSRELLSREILAQRGSVPDGYRLADREVFLGVGRGLFERAGEGVMNWRLQSGSGMRVDADGPAERGRIVRGRVGLGPGLLGLDIPCQVVWAERSEKLIGFGYGTLPGHPVHGEEAFVVEIDDEDRVTLRILAFSTPAFGILRAFPPASRLMQRIATEGYLRAGRKLRG